MYASQQHRATADIEKIAVEIDVWYTENLAPDSTDLIDEARIGIHVACRLHGGWHGKRLQIRLSRGEQRQCLNDLDMNRLQVRR